MIRKTLFAPDNYYHLFSRTILKDPVFADYNNSKKLRQCLLLSNSTKSSDIYDYLRSSPEANYQIVLEKLKEGEKLVDILCYAIMPDHYHLLVKERLENGIIRFARSCNTSVSKYINIKNDRKGPLFEGRFQSKHVDSNEYLLHLSLYIHLNPLDFLDSRNWRNGNLKNWREKKNKLMNYSFTSIKNYLAEDFSDGVISGSEIVKEQFKNKNEYEDYLREWAERDSQKIGKYLFD
jgi:putative transposase